MTTRSTTRLLAAVLASEDSAAPKTFDEIAQRYGEGNNTKAMLGTNAEERAAIASWLHVCLEKSLAPDASEDDVKRVLGEMDRVLKSSSFLASPGKETAADVAVFGALNEHLAKLGGGEALQKEFPNVARWAFQMQESIARRLGLGSYIRFAAVGTARSVVASVLASPVPVGGPTPSGGKDDEKRKNKKDGAGEGENNKIAATSPAATSASGEDASKASKKNKEQPPTTKDASTGASDAPGGAAQPPPQKKTKKEEESGKGGVKPAPPPAATGDTPAQFLPSTLDVRVGKILTAKKHAEADQLYVEEIDLGEKEGPRTICSGLVKYYATAEELVNKSVLVVCNLKPRNMKGVDSNGMVLAASNPDKSKVELISPPEGAKPGDKVVYQGAEGVVGEPLAPNVVNKKKILEEVLPGWMSDDKGQAGWKDTKTGKVHLMEVEGKGTCKSGILNGTVG